MRVPHEQLRELCLTYPAVAVAFWRDGTVDASVFAKWVGNLGRKNAKARIAHLFCEMAVRSESAGLGTRTSFELHATQEQLGDAAGLTPVHVNRTLQEIRGEGLLMFKNGRVDIVDWDTLVSVAEFDPGYLMLGGPPHRIGTRVPQRALVH
jgi:CRP-like cAMP-binding protein